MSSAPATTLLSLIRYHAGRLTSGTADGDEEAATEALLRALHALATHDALLVATAPGVSYWLAGGQADFARWQRAEPRGLETLVAWAQSRLVAQPRPARRC